MQHMDDQNPKTAAQADDAACVFEMLSLFVTLCGFFMLMASAFFYVDIYKSVRGAVMPVFGDIARALSFGGMTEEDHAELADIAEDRKRLYEELGHANQTRDRDAAEMVRQDLADLDERQHELLEDIKTRSNDGQTDEDAAKQHSEALQELTGDLKEKAEISRILGIIGAPMFLLGGIAYRAARAARKGKQSISA